MPFHGLLGLGKPEEETAFDRFTRSLRRTGEIFSGTPDSRVKEQQAQLQRQQFGMQVLKTRVDLFKTGMEQLANVAEDLSPEEFESRARSIFKTVEGIVPGISAEQLARKHRRKLERRQNSVKATVETLRLSAENLSPVQFMALLSDALDPDKTADARKKLLELESNRLGEERKARQKLEDARLQRALDLGEEARGERRATEAQIRKSILKDLKPKAKLKLFRGGQLTEDDFKKEGDELTEKDIVDIRNTLIDNARAQAVYETARAFPAVQVAGALREKIDRGEKLTLGEIVGGLGKVDPKVLEFFLNSMRELQEAQLGTKANPAFPPKVERRIRAGFTTRPLRPRAMTEAERRQRGVGFRRPPPKKVPPPKKESVIFITKEMHERLIRRLQDEQKLTRQEAINSIEDDNIRVR